MSNYLCVFISMREFLYGVNVYVFIPIVLFIIKSCQKRGFYLVLMYMYLFLECFRYG